MKENCLAKLKKRKGTTHHKRKIENKDKEKLKKLIQKLKNKIAQLEADIFAIKESEEYQTIQEIDDWDDYFAQLKQQLTAEIEQLENELTTFSTDDVELI